MGASAWLETTEVEVDPGTESAVEMRVRNTGAVMDEFSFSPVGMAQGWISVEPSIVSLFPGAEEGVQIHFRPPRLHTTLAGASPFAVKVVPREDPESTAVVEGTLHVTRSKSVASTWCPRPLAAGGSGRHTLVVRNTGNAALPIRLGGVDPKDQLRFDFNPSTVLVEPGTAQHARVQRAAPPRLLERRTPGRGRSSSSSTKRARTSPRSSPAPCCRSPCCRAGWARPSPASPPALVAFIALWFLLFKPAIEDTARDAVHDELAPIETALVASGITLPPTSVKGGTVPPPAPTTTTISPLGEPVRVPAVAGQPAVHRGRRGRRCYVTDLVLQNPDSNTGRITIAIDGQPVFDSALDFFRDLDRHLVAPLQVPAGSNLSPPSCAPGPRVGSARPPPPSAPSSSRTSAAETGRVGPGRRVSVRDASPATFPAPKAGFAPKAPVTGRRVQLSAPASATARGERRRGPEGGAGGSLEPAGLLHQHRGRSRRRLDRRPPRPCECRRRSPSARRSRR